MKNIMRLLTITLFVLLLVSSAYAAPGIGAILEGMFTVKEEPTFTASKELTKKLINQSVTVLTIKKGSCSGTVIYEDERNHYVLTAKHCIAVSEEMYVEHEKVLYIISSVDEDLAILVVDGKITGKKVAKLSKWKAYRGETVYHIGNPLEVLYKSSGKVVRDSDDWQYYSFKVIGGCSGGGIFNEDAELVAVVWGGYLRAKDKEPRKSVGEPLHDIESFLRLVLPEAL